MEAKEYQVQALERVRAYLGALDGWRAKNQKVMQEVGADASLDFPRKAWEEVMPQQTLAKHPYNSRSNGLRTPLPNFCLKIPTGGGKTYLAVRTIDAILGTYQKWRTGLVLWVVPTTQIYRQTLLALRGREHPYRQHLDIASGGRTLIVEKSERFSPTDVAEQLVVLLLMLPSANRETKETLRIFKDSGGFEAFFPSEDDAHGHRALLERIPNLDTFGNRDGFFGGIVKTSLGNTLRVLAPIIIMDEGHKAYSAQAQATLNSFNPSILVELSATPTAQSNVLVDVPGKALEREDMIKLPLHVRNQRGIWKDALFAAVEQRNALEADARVYESDSGKHIRPICLIQVERTGKDQRSARNIHADDAREYLITSCGVPAEQIAVKSSDRDDIEGIDLMDRECQIRFIITKYALQEGWDCAFAYVLAILTNPQAQNNLTQLVGRILRQPDARKTGVAPLDQSFVFCFQQQANAVLKSIKDGLEKEGLGDLKGLVAADDGEADGAAERTVSMRPEFRRFANRIYLPVFVIRDGRRWRKVVYESDILSRVDWSAADFTPLHNLVLGGDTTIATDVEIGLNEDTKKVITTESITPEVIEGTTMHPAFISRQLLDTIPNPWVAHAIAREVLDALRARYDAATISNHLVFIVGEIRKRAAQECDRLAQAVFQSLVHSNTIRFLMLRDDPGYRIPATTRVSGPRLIRRDNAPLQSSLFTEVAEDALNETERSVAWFLDEQERLLWWHRNMARRDYSIHGWRKHGIYPDFVFSGKNAGNAKDFDRIYVMEPKGKHLVGNDDTAYKRDVFTLCNRLARQASFSDELGAGATQRQVTFEVLPEDEWERKIREMLSGSAVAAHL